MAELRPAFNISDFENYGTISPYLSDSQREEVTEVTDRVNSQLDWVAQLLGWNGDYYWGNLVSSVAQKRQLLTGSFGVYNSYLYPDIVEVQNWNNTIVIKKNGKIAPGSTYYLGDESYYPSKVTESGDLTYLSFESLPDKFYSDLAAGEQLKVISPSSQPPPFVRPVIGTSGDASFRCEKVGLSLEIYPDLQTPLNLPYVYKGLFEGARYYFDKPVSLVLGPSSTIEPDYDFDFQRWFLTLPVNSLEQAVGLTGTLSYDGSFLEIPIITWEDPSDWGNKDIRDNFRGVWNNKGGKLPFHFAFDALEIHGFDEERSVYLGSLERKIPFDALLDHVYFQKAHISPGPPVDLKFSQVWWDSQSGSFSLHNGDIMNCGPWVEINYPYPPESPEQVDFVFPDVPSFVGYTGSIPTGCVVRILDIENLGPAEAITGITQTFTGNGGLDFVKYREEGYWEPLVFTFANESDFHLNAISVPSRVPVRLVNSSGLLPSSSNYEVSNLKVEINENLPLLLMKGEGGLWYISPPSNMKYIGNTRLFASSLDYGKPVEGELNWDFTVGNPEERSARIFYYNRITQDPITENLIIEGDWVSINSPDPSYPVPEVVNFGAVLIYCDGNLMEEDIVYRTENFQFVYSIDESTGEFSFLYTPLTYKGSVSFPRVTVSDSLTTSFVEDISPLVFSGLSYYMSPNVWDAQTLLRIWKSEKLRITSSLSPIELLRNPNPLVADLNEGPGDENWERYFVRLPPSYEREGSVWQKVNLICQNFGYWGSAISPERMQSPSEKAVPLVYESLYLSGSKATPNTCIYEEPYLFSDVVYDSLMSGDYEESSILPGFEKPFDDFEEAQVVSYSPLHNRKADVSSPVGRGYGEWEGSYYRKIGCCALSGHLVKDLDSGCLEPINPPIWDSSIYKAPPFGFDSETSSSVDANHYKVGYAFFAADLSVAEDGVFDFRGA